MTLTRKDVSYMSLASSLLMMLGAVPQLASLRSSPSVSLPAYLTHTVWLCDGRSTVCICIYMYVCMYVCMYID